MAHDDHEGPEETWGNDIARVTFILTIVLAGLFLAAVVFFIL